MKIKTIAIVGCGVIGIGWAGRFLASGFNVIATDPAKNAEKKLKEGINNAWPSLKRIGLAKNAKKSNLKFVNTIEEAVKNADWIQESAPENELLKRKLISKIDSVARKKTIIASSSSGLLPSNIQKNCKYPERVIVAHPFNPVYILPLVELVKGKKTSPRYMSKAKKFFKSIGMRPLIVRKEVEGYIADRLQEALWREALHIVKKGNATTQEVDDAIVYGPGVRWAFMGVFLTFHMAGGKEGMKHMLEQFGPALKLPWTELKAPTLTNKLRKRLITGTKKQSNNISVKKLEKQRDDFIIKLLESFKKKRLASFPTWNKYK
jgi:carnitine 3-dehydrogenase